MRPSFVDCAARTAGVVAAGNHTMSGEFAFTENGEPDDPIGHILYLGGYKFNGSYGSSIRYRKDVTDKLDETFGDEWHKFKVQVEWIVIDSSLGGWSNVLNTLMEIK